MSGADRTREQVAAQEAAAPERRRSAAPPTPADLALRLQQSAGNRVVSRLVSDGRLPDKRGERMLARRPIQVRGARTEQRTGSLGVFVGRTAFEVDFVGMEAIITVKVKLRRGTGVSVTDADAVKARAAATFNAMWDERFIFIDQSNQTRWFVRTRVEWVASGEHISVLLRAGDKDIDQTRWSVGDQSIEFAHEISHTLGLRDEYVDPTSVRRRTATSPGVHRDHSLMGNYFNEGIPQAEVKLRHGQAVADSIGNAMRPRKRFTAIFSGYAQGARLLHWRGIRDAAATGSTERAAAAAEVQAIEADMMIPQLAAAAGVPYAPTP